MGQPAWHLTPAPEDSMIPTMVSSRVRRVDLPFQASIGADTNSAMVATRFDSVGYRPGAGDGHAIVVDIRVLAVDIGAGRDVIFDLTIRARFLGLCG